MTPARPFRQIERQPERLGRFAADADDDDVVRHGHRAAKREQGLQADALLELENGPQQCCSSAKQADRKPEDQRRFDTSSRHNVAGTPQRAPS